MIKITDGTNTKIVTVGMYTSLYSNMGYKPVGTKIEPKEEPKVIEPKVEEPKVEEPKKEEVKVVPKERFNKKK